MVKVDRILGACIRTPLMFLPENLLRTLIVRPQIANCLDYLDTTRTIGAQGIFLRIIAIVHNFMLASTQIRIRHVGLVGYHRNRCDGESLAQSPQRGFYVAS